jgi:3-oxoacyl-[acyl-carrier-protein] synthase II
MDHVKFLEDRGPKRVNPFTLAQSNINTGVTSVAQWFYLKGTGHTIATACSSATHAISVGALHIQCGIEDVMVVGGAEGSIDKYMFSGFDRMRAMSTRNDDPKRACRPFDRDRDGFVMGEGAGILVLEELEHARKRGAHIYGEVIGYGYSQDAYKIAQPDPYGTAAIHAIKKAINMAKISTEEVEYINAHGTSTPLNDSTESFILKQVFDDYAYRIPISSSKSYFGHAIGAAGGLEAIVTLLIMEHGVIAPTANLENPDLDYIDPVVPELDKRCDLDYVPLVKREKDVNISLSESFGFGGQNGAIIFKRLEH